MAISLVEPMLQEVVYRQEVRSAKCYILLSFLFGVAAVLTLPYTRYAEEPVKTTLASELFATTFGRTMGIARAPRTAIHHHVLPTVMQAPVHELFERSHLTHGTAHGRSNIFVRAEIEEEVKKMIAEQLSVDEAKVTNEATFIGDLGADSLDAVELIMALEEKFGVEIPEEEAQKLTTVQSVIDYAKAAKK